MLTPALAARELRMFILLCQAPQHQTGNNVDTTNRCEALKYYTFLKYVKYQDVSLSNTSLSNIQMCNLF